MTGQRGDTKKEETRPVEALVGPDRGPGPRTSCVIVLDGSAVGTIHRLTGDMVVGRTPEAGLVIREDGVSRRHAMLRVLPDGEVHVTDLDSTNGIYRNGERVKECVLFDGDRLQVGRSVFLKFSYRHELDESWQANLCNSATRDALTQVHNRWYFNEALKREYVYAVRHQVRLALLMIDIDNFRLINDTHGQSTGDGVLQQLARTMAAALRADDVLARHGGEEFVVLLRETPGADGGTVAEHIRQEVDIMPFAVAGIRIHVTVSIGVATVTDASHLGPDDLVRVADKCLYRAKRAGRNRVVSSQ